MHSVRLGWTNNNCLVALSMRIFVIAWFSSAAEVFWKSNNSRYVEAVPSSAILFCHGSICHCWIPGELSRVIHFVFVLSRASTLVGYSIRNLVPRWSASGSQFHVLGAYAHGGPFLGNFCEKFHFLVAFANILRTLVVGLDTVDVLGAISACPRTIK